VTAVLVAQMTPIVLTMASSATVQSSAMLQLAVYQPAILVEQVKAAMNQLISVT